MKRFATFVVKKRIAILVCAVLLLIPSVIGAAATHINYDILSYLPGNLESIVGERYLENDYKIASTAMVVLENKDSRQVLRIKDDLSRIDGIDKVLWIDDLADVSIPKEMLPQDARDIFYGKNGATLIVVTFTGTSSSESTMNAVAAMKKTLDKDCFVGGMASVSQDTKTLVDGEMPLFTLTAAGLVLMILFLSMESTLIPIIFLVGIGFAVLYNFGTNVFLGEISFITKALAAVLQLAVTMDFSIFLLHRYEEEKVRWPDHDSAMAAAIQKTFSSIIGGSMTAMAGFLAMCTMSLTLGIDIGVVMAKGVFLSVLTTLTVLPSLILVFDRPIEKYRHRVWIPKMKRTSRFIVRHPVAVLSVMVLLVLPFVFAQTKTSVYYNLLDSLPATLNSSQGNQKLKDEFNMTSTHFILADDSLSNAQANRMDQDISKLDGVTQVISLEKYVGGAIPQTFLPLSLTENLKKDGKELMMVNSSYKTASSEQNAQLDGINAIIKRYDSGAIVTGEAAMTKDLISVADRDFKAVNITSILAVFLIIALAFQSGSLPFILVLTIEAAISVNMGLPYFTGTTIPFISSIVIGTIQLGATIDYAILMTNRFREERGSGKDKRLAAQLAIENCSQSIMTSALAFFLATIGVALICDMDLIRSLCLMLARGAIISMVIILILLPCLLILFSGLIEKTSRRWLRAPQDNNIA